MIIGKIGPAFPAPAGVSHITEQGMSLRDYFAAKAMEGICASGPANEWTNERLTAEAYDSADAMLKARQA